MSTNYEIVVVCPADRFREIIGELAELTEHLDNGPGWEEMLERVHRGRKGSRHRFSTTIRLRVPLSEVDEENSFFYQEASKDGVRYLVTKGIHLIIVLGRQSVVLFFHAIYSATSSQFHHHSPLQMILFDLCRPRGYFALFYDESEHYIMVDKENRFAGKKNYISTTFIDVRHYLDPDDWRWISDACDDADRFTACCLEQIKGLDAATRNLLELHVPDEIED